MTPQQISEAMRQLAIHRWSKVSKKKRIAHARMMVEKREEKRKNKVN